MHSHRCHRPAFALTAILILALGIGTTTAIFSIVDAELLRPLSWTEPDRLVIVHAVHPQRLQNPAYAATWNRGTFSFPAWDAMRASSVFEDVAVWRRMRLDTTIGPERIAIVPTARISANFLPMLG